MATHLDDRERFSLLEAASTGAHLHNVFAFSADSFEDECLGNGILDATMRARFGLELLSRQDLRGASQQFQVLI